MTYIVAKIMNKYTMFYTVANGSSHYILVLYYFSTKSCRVADQIHYIFDRLDILYTIYSVLNFNWRLKDKELCFLVNIKAEKNWNI